MATRKFLIGPKNVIDKNETPWQTRLVIGIPTTGLLRAEWVSSRFSQIIPTNWSHIEAWQMMSSRMPLNYQIADAENLIAKTVVESEAEWLLSIESDNIIPPNTFRKMNEYMIDKTYPVVGGLYFTKSVPPEPMIYRGLGNGYYSGWKFGDKVMCDGLPFGCTLIHGDIIREIWKDSPEYAVNGQLTRRVFDNPAEGWKDPVTGAWLNKSGTTDLNFFHKVKSGGYLARAGWKEHQKMKYPYMVDTTIFVRHIDNNGVQWPLDIPAKFDPGPKRIKQLMKEFSGPFK